MADVLAELLDQIEAEARSAPFPVDSPVYESYGKDPMTPLPYAGNPAARICSFGRDPGRDEIRHWQPQVGAAGKLVRQGVLDAVGVQAPSSDKRLETALEYVYLSNTVPYKPIGNKAYADRIKERFRPFIERLLLEHWQGDVVLTLGTEAFDWFARYAEPGAATALWKQEDRYENGELKCRLQSAESTVQREIIVCPLPHPSPLNQAWVGKFPGLLQTRLEKWTRNS